jgi:hypothetical protein
LVVESTGAEGREDTRRVEDWALVEINGSPVRLHIYDVSQKSYIQWLNAVLAHRYSPVKCGGIFHVGVEVYGKEWIFGHCKYGTGVSAIEPCSHPDHHFRETVTLNETKFSKAEVGSILRDLMDNYQGESYNLFTRNCCHFADDFCQQVGSGPIPRWVYRLAGLGSAASYLVDNLSGERTNFLHLSRSLSTAQKDASFRTGLTAPVGDFCPAPLPRSPTAAALPPSVAVGMLLRGTSRDGVPF